MNKSSLWIAILLIGLGLSGCADIAKKWKDMISDSKPEDQSKQQKPTGITYSQQNSYLPGSYRKYKRTKRADLEDQSHLESKAGSLWVMEGQGAYLFSQNIVRMIGDPLAVKLEGDSQEQLSSKTKVISKLLAQLEDRRRRALGRGPAGAPGAAAAGPETPAEGDKKTPDKKAAAKSPPGAPPAPGDNQPPSALDSDKGEFNVKMVPTRVVERLVDGNYRVRGTQPFMIGQREYKVIVTGIVRSEDFNEQGITSAQLLDSNFDIVSAKGAEMRQ